MFEYRFVALRNTSVANIWANWFESYCTICMENNWHWQTHQRTNSQNRGHSIQAIYQTLKSEYRSKYCYCRPSFAFIESITLNCFFCCFIQYRDNMNGTKHLTRKLLIDNGFVNVTDNDIDVVQYVSAIISHRAALLVSIPTSVLLNRMTHKDITVAIDGSVYKNHPRMDAWLTRLITILTNSKKTVCQLYNLFSDPSNLRLTNANDCFYCSSGWFWPKMEVERVQRWQQQSPWNYENNKTNDHLLLELCASVLFPPILVN